MATNLEVKIAELQKLMAAEKLDTKAIVAVSREIDSIQRDAEKGEADKHQKAFAALNMHISTVLTQAIKSVIADGGIEKLHGKACVLRYTVTFSETAEPIYAAVITSGVAKVKASGGGGGGGGGQRGDCMGTHMTMQELVDKYGTPEQKSSFAASTDKNVRYGIAKACAKLHTA